MPPKATGTVVGRVVDLDAHRKAQAETAPDAPAPSVVLGGKTFGLPRKLNATVAINLGLVNRGDLAALKDVADELFGDKADAVLKLGLGVKEFDLIIEGAYGEDPGESAASET